MTGALGIDHPLVGVRDLEAARRTYQSLGFAMKPPGRHPWGTSTALVIFRRQLLELVSIWDDGLLDSHPAGEFRFGRHVASHLAQGEGVALSALYSDDAEGDATAVVSRGGHCEGTIRFGRDVVLADGTTDRTSTVLKIFTRPELSRLSIFVCQQFRRDLIEFPEWMDHPNGATGFASATILAESKDHDRVRDWLQCLHGVTAEPTAWGFRVRTGNGWWRVASRNNAETLFGPVPEMLAPDGAPSVASLDLRVTDLNRLHPFLKSGDFAYREIDRQLVLTETDRLGGILLSFQEG
ncbi:VOC family protein [Paracoccus saliphilus]|uniref:Glyoxalase-like domain-containing protein n=1 Tax=Paracoccus saliphilus TaxID=405559 RepID=A0AA46A7N7_9RHOB|nr:VOC family protein [Paracoccus saliphilus]WCR02971.1 VOC family protein [Paracoccus saliphilus]SIT16392.1 Glyoxalase-like domain-containing protein [Paracoccus saliphilus]